MQAKLFPHFADVDGILYVLEVAKQANGLPEVKAQNAASHAALHEAIKAGGSRGAGRVDGGSVDQRPPASFGNGVGVQLDVHKIVHDALWSYSCASSGGE